MRGYWGGAGVSGAAVGAEQRRVRRTVARGPNPMPLTACPPPPPPLLVAQMEVGIEDCLHIEFEYDKGTYHLKDTVVGKIYFLLVRPPSGCGGVGQYVEAAHGQGALGHRVVCLHAAPPLHIPNPAPCAP